MLLFKEFIKNHLTLFQSYKKINKVINEIDEVADKLSSKASNVQNIPVNKNEQNNVTDDKYIGSTPKNNSGVLSLYSENQNFKSPSLKTSELFTVKTANEWIKEAATKPVPKMILGELWFEGEICILFADTNVGKSINAVQIANSISKGESVEPFTLEIDKKKALYFDFELTDLQFTNRYSVQEDGKFINAYDFNDNFLRVEINRDNNIDNFRGC